MNAWDKRDSGLWSAVSGGCGVGLVAASNVGLNCLLEEQQTKYRFANSSSGPDSNEIILKRL